LLKKVLPKQDYVEPGLWWTYSIK